MVTCHLRFILNPRNLKKFEHYRKLWIPLVDKFGGHHGYFLPSEGANNVGLAMFTFPSLAEYEQYRKNSFEDPACVAAFKYAEDTQCKLLAHVLQADFQCLTRLRNRNPLAVGYGKCCAFTSRLCLA